MEKLYTNNTDKSQGIYDDFKYHVIKPGESVTLRYVDPTNQIELKLEDLSNPPLGRYSKIKNIYVDLNTKKTIVEFKDDPEE